MIKKLIFRILGVLVTLGVGLPLILFVLVYNDFFGHVPDETEIQNIHNLEASVVYNVRKKRLSNKVSNLPAAC